jgi:glycine oxidase
VDERGDEELSMPESSEVVVVGGGVAGCATAYYLSRAGVKVTLIERDGIGRQASGYSAGGINPLHGYLDTLQALGMASYTLHRALWDELRNITGQDCQQRIISMIMVAFDEAEIPELQRILERFQATAGFAAHWLDAVELHELEPRLTSDALRGLYLYGNGVVDSHLFTVRLAEAAQHYGAVIRHGEVQGIAQVSGRSTGVVLADGTLPCDAVVLAMGPWAKAAQAWLGLSLPVEPLKGEILRMLIPGPALVHDFGSADILLCSRPGGQVWCAATEERRGFDTQPSEFARDFLWQRAQQLMPAMAQATLLEQTVCLRPVTPDWLPIIGRAPGWQNVYLATGGAKKGILLGPGMGQAIADLITTGHTALPVAPYTPERFAGIVTAD